MEGVVKGESWGKDKRGFEQHMLEEDRVMSEWQAGAFEETETCKSCGSENAWDLVHQCCQRQCQETLNALQAFPYAAWDDISAAPLDPAKVSAARKLRIEYAEKKPVWKKILRTEAKAKGWKIVKSRWIDITKRG